jgi:hypothetical protein
MGASYKMLIETGEKMGFIPLKKLEEL